MEEIAATKLDVMIRRAGSNVYIARGQDVRKLNSVAARIWSLIDGRHTRDAIASVIAEEYEASLIEITRDVAEFIDAMKAAGFIEVSGL